ncbi:MAG TPA: 30S ribosomal protein S12 methylthiotransferase RimO [Streptosporangiaceae bacterium]|nr:30S ribosomal protein S12 methylthiotransferase RimO [Streptosporangiaceae bacterium]
MSSRTAAAGRSVRLVTLGCARNEVDSEELAARLEAGGWTLTDGDGADVVVVNTCGFIQAAKQESIDELLTAADSGATVVAAGCMAERYGSGLAEAMPEAQVLSFDDYANIAERLDAVHAGARWQAHEPRDRRKLLPISPARRPGAGSSHVPGHSVPASAPDLPAGDSGGSSPLAYQPRVLRRRLGGGIVAPLKIASGCDRRCSFCAIPAFRGAFISRPPADLLAEAGWLAGHGARELVLVSENSTSYGKDLGDLRLLESLLPSLATVPGIDRVRVSYLQPAEVRPGLIEVMTSTPKVAPYFDLSFQHASGTVLRAMRRFGDGERFRGLIEQIRKLAPGAGIRSNFIVGFPGETGADVAELEKFLIDARLDAIGVFGYSDEDGTEAATLPGQIPESEIADRVSALSSLADELMDQRAAERVGEEHDVLIEEPVPGEPGWVYTGRTAHQAPEVDGSTQVRSDHRLEAGELVRVRVSGSEGVDLMAELVTGRRGPLAGSLESLG